MFATDGVVSCCSCETGELKVKLSYYLTQELHPEAQTKENELRCPSVAEWISSIG